VGLFVKSGRQRHPLFGFVCLDLKFVCALDVIFSKSDAMT
jgi:hypothetical protein